MNVPDHCVIILNIDHISYDLVYQKNDLHAKQKILYLINESHIMKAKQEFS